MITSSRLFIALVVGCGGQAALGQAVYDVPRYYPPLTAGDYRTFGDFDNDGDPDVIQTTGSGPMNWLGFTIFMNDGDRGLRAGQHVNFDPPLTSTQFVGRGAPKVGDVDGDGNLDVLFDRVTTLGVSIQALEIYRGDGLGAFKPKISLALPAAAAIFDVGQIDADPAVEIVVMSMAAQIPATLSWYDWNGTSFVQSASLAMTAPADPDGGLRRTVVVDIDGDGDDDVVATNGAQDKLRIVLTVNGQPTYGPAALLPADFVNPNVFIGAGDLDNDGDADILLLRRMFTIPDGVRLLVFENQSAGLVAHSSQVIPFPNTFTQFDASSLAFSDWDLDGIRDNLGGGEVFVALRGLGGLTWEYGASVWMPGSALDGRGVGDFDQDGFLDAIADGSIYYGRGLFNDVQAGFGDPIGLSFPDGPKIGDIDDDGDLDMTGGEHRTRQENDATGRFTSIVTEFLPPGGGMLYGKDVAYGDFTGDGHPDWLVSKFKVVTLHFIEFIGMYVLAGDGFGNATELGKVSSQNIPAKIVGNDLATWGTADVDNDGDQDLLVEDGYYANTNTQLVGPVGSYVGLPLAAADFDQDGDDDIITQSGTNVVLWQPGPSGFQATTLAVGGGEWGAQWIDLDGDQDLDVVVGSDAASGIQLLENQSGNLIHVGTLAADLRRGRNLATEDVDGDGMLDLIATHIALETQNDQTMIAYFRSNGPGTSFEPADYYFVPGTFALFDVDGDSDTDAFGWHLIDNLKYDEPDSGAICQYGVGAPGNGGIVPLLGAHGPLWIGATNAEMRFRRGAGGASALIIVGLNPTELSPAPTPNMTLYVDPQVILPVTLSGSAGEVGTGEFNVPLTTTGALAGVPLYFQVYVFDPGAPNGAYANSNGLKVIKGM